MKKCPRCNSDNTKDGFMDMLKGGTLVLCLNCGYSWNYQSSGETAK